MIMDEDVDVPKCNVAFEIARGQMMGMQRRCAHGSTFNGSRLLRLHTFID